MAKRYAIRTKRIYDAASPSDGQRILVDRLWPRGVTREKAQIAEWAREVAPSDALRAWFGHEPAKWEEFQERYAAELEANEAAWRPIAKARRAGVVTLLFAAKDAERNNAVALKAYLESKR
jgi:uncharacterized protein YeaO (DUF488 family)